MIGRGGKKTYLKIDLNKEEGSWGSCGVPVGWHAVCIGILYRTEGNMVIKCVIFSVLLSRSRCGVQSLLFGTDDYARCVDRTEGTMVRKSVNFSWFQSE